MDLMDLEEEGAVTLSTWGEVHRHFPLHFK